jgi:hypothetical protein
MHELLPGHQRPLQAAELHPHQLLSAEPPQAWLLLLLSLVLVLVLTCGLSTTASFLQQQKWHAGQQHAVQESRERQTTATVS